MSAADNKTAHGLSDRRDFLINQVSSIRDEILLLYTKVADRALTISIKCDRAKKFSAEFDEVEQKLFQHNAIARTSKKGEVIPIDDARAAMDSIMDEILEISHYTNKILNTNESNTSPGVSKAHLDSAAHLRPVELPKFDGNNFNHFWGVFTALVDETNLSSVVKFHHLCSSLNEEGTAVIAEYLPISAQNYPLAKEALLRTYKNERKQATQLVLNMLNYQPLANSHKTADVAQLVNKFGNSINGLQQMNIDKLDEFLLFNLLYSKLDNKLRFAYEQSTGSSKEIPTHSSLIEFLQKRIQMGELNEMIHPNTNSNTNVKAKPPNNNSPIKTSRTKGTFLASNNSDSICPCPKNSSNNHRLYKCQTFKEMEVNKRIKYVRDNNICRKCLNKHEQQKCSFQYNCRHCAGDHNSLLCKTQSSSASNDATNESPGPEASVTTAMSAAPVPSTSVNHSSSNTQELLATAMVIVKDDLGQDVKLRALIDTGSQSNFITERAAQLLHCQRENDNTQITGISGASMHAKGRVTVIVKSPTSSSNDFSLDALVLNKICGEQPSRNVAESSIAPSRNLQLADPTWGTPRPVDLLLGIGVYTQIISSSQPIVSLSRELKAQYTILGYLIFGTAKIESLIATNDELTHLVEKMWELDQLPNAEKSQDPEDILVENFYAATTKRDENGHYVVKLPFRPNAIPLVENKYPPMQAYLKTEKRLQNSSNDAALYRQYFQDYLDEGKMIPATDHSSYLLIHHPVKKVASSTSKVRPVFNASAPDRMGRTLNEMLLKGPNLVADIFDVLFSFRLQPIAFVCDVKQMYNSVLVDSSDWQYQHILWRKSPDDDVREYALTRVTFGMAPSSYLAQRTVKQLVIDEGNAYPLASQALQKQLYVDDVAASYSTVEVAKQAKNELIELMEKGGFMLRKFASSHPEMLDDMPDNYREPIEFNDENADLKILGLAWCPVKDTFFFKVQEFSGAINKRTILSYSARIFDVKGILTPVTVLIRIFIKHLWQIQCNWDEPLCEELEKKWLCIVANMPALSSLHLPRVIPIYSCKYVELIGFCDGSSVAHAAALYLRCVYDEHAEMYLIRSKGKVNPMKPQLSIPRVELQGAKLLVDLYNSVLPRIENLPILKTTFLTDSKVVLAWLRIPPHKLQLFVSNRVAHIIHNTNVNDWNYVPSADNCADPASRGLLPEQMFNNELWWNGPDFLRQPEPEWSPPPEVDQEIPELKKEVVTTLLSSTIPDDNFETEIVNHFSSLNRLNRVVAWMRRFKYNCLAKAKGLNKLAGPLSCAELANANAVCVRQVQNAHYAESILAGTIPRNLRSLTPFVDPENGIIRIGGRLDKAPLPYISRHPILIPKESHLAVLIANEAHRATLHGGPLIMKATIQQRYWIVGITKIVKNCTFNCRRCYVLRAKPPVPMMAELPASRFNTRRAFINVSCDFAGPFNVHEGHRPRAKILKTYVCVFTCMSTRAIHLEVVQDLSSASYLAALDRMVARRGLCQMIFCDNGTNFVGAAKELKNVIKSLASYSKEIQAHLAMHQVQFKFNTPISPWKNGITERVVGLFKSHLTRVVGNSMLTYSEFNTLVIQIEAVLNSRPLIPLSVNYNDGIILTPGHFLTGDALLAAPAHDLADVSHLSRWQSVKLAFQSFWRLWRTQYLQTLIERSKWQDPTANIEINQVVILKQENTPPLQWPLGIVQEIYPHSDNTVRVVKVKTMHGSYLRPVNKVIPLAS